MLFLSHVTSVCLWSVHYYIPVQAYLALSYVFLGSYPQVSQGSHSEPKKEGKEGRKVSSVTCAGTAEN